LSYPILITLSIDPNIMSLAELKKLCQKKVVVCQGCRQEYSSNVNHTYCDLCEDIKQEIFLKTMMDDTWEKFVILITYRIDYIDHAKSCKKNKAAKQYQIEKTTLKFDLLTNINSHNISASGEFILDNESQKYFENYCKDDTTLCRCGHKIVYTIISARVEKDESSYRLIKN
jgi:hypothetical protein